MGACASVFSAQKNSAEAPPPAPEEELASKEVKLVEETPVEKEDEAPLEADEAKHQSLGHLFKGVKSNDGEKGSVDTNGKTSEEVKQDESEKSSKSEEAQPASENVEIEAKKIEEKPVESVNLEKEERLVMLKAEKPEENKPVEVSGNDEEPVTEKSSKSEDPQPASEMEMEAKKIEEKPVESVKLEREEVVEILKTEKPENKPVEVSGNDEKPETTEIGKYEGQTPASDADKMKEEEKPIEIVTLEKKPETLETEEQKPASDAEKKMVEVKPTDISTIETSAKVEDKHVLEPLKTEESLDKKPNEESVRKPEIPEMSSEDQKPASDAEIPIAEEKATK